MISVIGTSNYHEASSSSSVSSQKSITQKIIEGNSDYILSLKDNQTLEDSLTLRYPTLHQQVKNWFETSLSFGFKGVDVSISQRVEKGHHRIENRQVYTVPVSQLPTLHEQDDWVGLTTVVMVVRDLGASDSARRIYVNQCHKLGNFYYKEELPPLTEKERKDFGRTVEKSTKN
ncbi:MAG: hypothetical protein V7L21_28245 [Nostoc sp.]|uniref:hypothetical protein n=1 Tax=Nostoc sp. TaxID=1180 RepID=UPI002FF71056